MVRKKRLFLFVAISVLCLFAFTACPTGEEEDGPPNVIAGGDLTGMAALPTQGERMYVAVENGEFTGSIEWARRASYTDSFITPAVTSVSTFQPGMLYRATITMTAKKGYTFKDTAENSFTHAKGSASNPTGGGGGF
jgi:hypothetical protein